MVLARVRFERNVGPFWRHIWCQLWGHPGFSGFVGLGFRGQGLGATGPELKKKRHRHTQNKRKTEKKSKKEKLKLKKEKKKDEEKKKKKKKEKERYGSFGTPVCGLSCTSS